MHAYLTEFAEQCAKEPPTETGEKFVEWEYLVTTLVSFGLGAALPELKEWVKLGVAGAALCRQKLQKKLVDYARESELDFPAAEEAAGAVAKNVNEENLGEIIEALEG